MNQAQNQLHAMTLRPLAKQRVWGSDTVPAWYAGAAHELPVGELWLTAVECIAEGMGGTLGEVACTNPAAFGGSDGHSFPVLVKVLLPSEKLSVQVHPNDAQAQAMGAPRGKTECWYVLSAEPGATVAVGFREPLTVAQVEGAIADGSLEDQLRMLPVSAGDMVYVDAGTVHAIGPGLVLLEVQQYSDTTFRLFDYGRNRELHLEEGLAVTKTVTAAGLVSPVEMDGFTRLLACSFFVVDKFTAMRQPTLLNDESGIQVLVALADGCLLRSGKAADLALPAGYAVVLPANGERSELLAPGDVPVIRIAAR